MLLELAHWLEPLGVTMPGAAGIPSGTSPTRIGRCQTPRPLATAAVRWRWRIPRPLAATAVRCAALGYRTVVLSTDLAHSLADSLDVPLGPEPSLVAPNLWLLISRVDVEPLLNRLADRGNEGQPEKKKELPA